MLLLPNAVSLASMSTTDTMGADLPRLVCMLGLLCMLGCQLALLLRVNVRTFLAHAAPHRLTQQLNDGRFVFRKIVHCPSLTRLN